MPKLCKILIVEDNKEIRDILAFYSLIAYRFPLPPNGTEMRHLLATDTFASVIDLLLPCPDGGLILAQEAADRGIILVTGSYSHHETTQKSGYNYLLKPYRLASLMTFVDQN